MALKIPKVTFEEALSDMEEYLDILAAKYDMQVTEVEMITQYIEFLNDEYENLKVVVLQMFDA